MEADEELGNNGEEIQQECPYCYDEDLAYENWREREGELLEQSLFKILEDFYKNNPYYKGCRSKIIQHSEVFLKGWKK